MTATFYLGTHQPQWLYDERFRDVPLFVSSRRLQGRVSPWPRAVGRWALDSGGFTEIRMFGEWTITPREYMTLVCRYAREIGMPDFVAPQDWMCEPWVIEGKNQHLTRTDPKYFHGTRAARGVPGDGPEEPFDDAVLKHQRWTVDNYLLLRDIAAFMERQGLAPEGLAGRIIPVLQGWELQQYLRCVDMYYEAGVDLQALGVVGLGSVCRRQDTDEIAEIVETLAEERGLTKNHGFGVKIDGLGQYGSLLGSADSQAWSEGERRLRRPRFPECVGVHKNCANCPKAALRWRRRVLASLAGARPRFHPRPRLWQPSLFDELGAAS